MRNSPTAQLWQYPLSRPSWRFNYFNDFVRGLDTRFAALSDRGKNFWEWYWRNFPWSALCLEQFFDPDSGATIVGSGLQAYRNYNCLQLMQGLPVVDVPPSIATVPNNDTITIFGSDPLSVTWGGRDETPVGEFVACVRDCSLNHAPERGPNVSRMRFSFQAPIEYGVPFSVAACLANRPGAAYMPALAVGVSISDVQGVTFGAGRVCFLRPYV